MNSRIAPYLINSGPIYRVINPDPISDPPKVPGEKGFYDGGVYLGRNVGLCSSVDSRCVTLGQNWRPDNNKVCGQLKANCTDNSGNQSLLAIESLYKIGLTNGVIRVLVGTGSGWTETQTTTASIQEDQEFLVEFCFDYSPSANESYVKVDGVTVWSSSTTFTFLGSSRDFVIGAFQGVGDFYAEFFNGFIFDLQITDGTLIGNYPINEGIGNTINDTIGSIDGTIRNYDPVFWQIAWTKA